MATTLSLQFIMSGEPGNPTRFENILGQKTNSLVFTEVLFYFSRLTKIQGCTKNNKRSNVFKKQVLKKSASDMR